MNLRLKLKYRCRKDDGGFKSDHTGTSGKNYFKKKRQGNGKRRRSYGPFDTFLGSGLSSKEQES